MLYLRDERPHAGTAPPAVLYRYTPGRKGEHAQAQLARFTGYLHADGYAGFGRLYDIASSPGVDAALLQGPARVAEVACWSHVRRGFFDVHAANGSKIAKETLDRIGALFDIERTIVGHAAEIRKCVRQRAAKPRIDDLATWFCQSAPNSNAGSKLRAGSQTIGQFIANLLLVCACGALPMPQWARTVAPRRSASAPSEVM